MNSNGIIKFNGRLGTLVKDYDNKDVLKFLPCNHGCYYTSQLETVTYEMVEKTTFEEKKRFIKTEYHWGSVIDIHTIGEYQIIEDSRGSFHLYIDFKDTSTSFPSLDAALIGAVCRKHDGSNERLSGYVCKALGME